MFLIAQGEYLEGQKHHLKGLDSIYDLILVIQIFEIDDYSQEHTNLTIGKY